MDNGTGFTWTYGAAARNTVNMLTALIHVDGFEKQLLNIVNYIRSTLSSHVFWRSVCKKKDWRE
ncbi:hypothetical protein [Sporosarcina limicola]|uniref:Type III secretory pathway component EscV n=1 Tax=Sporosarcina limicola TaxID=34101 RepID=A0A927MIP8_9BACL|nr:hypothetical protein [Sporosarcina limicola]MBE1555395.1 type III secretory pathway component EscV [Sporosarcina limicola]